MEGHTANTGFDPLSVLVESYSTSGRSDREGEKEGDQRQSRELLEMDRQSSFGVEELTDSINSLRLSSEDNYGDPLQSFTYQHSSTSSANSYVFQIPPLVLGRMVNDEVTDIGTDDDNNDAVSHGDKIDKQLHGDDDFVDEEDDDDNNDAVSDGEKKDNLRHDNVSDIGTDIDNNDAGEDGYKRDKQVLDDDDVVVDDDDNNDAGDDSDKRGKHDEDVDEDDDNNDDFDDKNDRLLDDDKEEEEEEGEDEKNIKKVFYDDYDDEKSDKQMNDTYDDFDDFDDRQLDDDKEEEEEDDENKIKKVLDNNDDDDDGDENNDQNDGDYDHDVGKLLDGDKKEVEEEEEEEEEEDIIQRHNNNDDDKEDKLVLVTNDKQVLDDEDGDDDKQVHGNNYNNNDDDDDNKDYQLHDDDDDIDEDVHDDDDDKNDKQWHHGNDEDANIDEEVHDADVDDKDKLLRLVNDEDEEDDEEDEEDDDPTISEEAGKYQEESAETLQRGLAVLYSQVELSDLKVKVGKKVFHCHKVVLASFSNYFRTLVTSGMRESLRNEVTIKTIRPRCFRMILSYIYRGCDIFSDNEEIEELLEASVILQIRHLEEKCIEHIASNLHTGNCLQILEMCERHACFDLAFKARDLALKNFEKVMKETNMLFLDRELLVDLMADKQLNVSSEDALCFIVLKWVEADPKKRSASLRYLFQSICLPKVSGAFLYKHLLHNDLVQADPQLRERIDDALRYQLVPDERDGVMRKQRVFREGENYRRVLLLIGGNITDEEILRNVSCFDVAKNFWYTLESAPQHFGEDFATCLLDNDVYLTGGSRHLNLAACFNSAENSWCLLPKLNHGRESHAMVAVAGNVYVLGGRDYKKKTKDKLVREIEMFTDGETSWRVIGEMNPPREAFACSALGTRIFIYGGRNAEGVLDDVTSFDVRTGALSAVSYLPQREYYLQSVKTPGDEIYLVSASGNVYSHARNDQIKTLFHLPLFRRQRFSLTSDGGTITVVGGISDEGRCDRIDSISLQSRSMRRLGTMFIPMDGMQVHSVVMSNNYLIQAGMSIGEPEPNFPDFDDFKLV